MITLNGYAANDNGIEGIAVTWGKDLIEEKGGLLSFIRFFTKTMATEDGLWLQKCRNKPSMDILYVYIVVCNQIRYRLYYAGYERGEKVIYNGDGASWCSSSVITWPRIVCAGPLEVAPFKIKQKGFQGFRYTTKLF